MENECSNKLFLLFTIRQFIQWQQLAKAREQKLNPQQTRDYVLELMLLKMDHLITLLNPFITEPIGYDRLIDPTTRKGKKVGGGTVYSDSDSPGDALAKSILT